MTHSILYSLGIFFLAIAAAKGIYALVLYLKQKKGDPHE